MLEVSIKIFQNKYVTTCKKQMTSCDFPVDAQNKLQSERFVKEKVFQALVQPKQLDGLRTKASA